MRSLAQISHAFTEAGPLHERIPLWGFVDEAAFLCKTGAVGLVVEVRGIDDECLDHATCAQITHRFRAALRPFDEACRVYQYRTRRPHPPIPAPPHPHPVVHAALDRRATYLSARGDALAERRLIYVVLYEAPDLTLPWRRRLARLVATPRHGLRDLLSSARTITLVDAALTRAVAQLRHRVDAFVTQLADTLAPRVLPKAEAFTVLRRLVNYDRLVADAVRLKTDEGLDFHVADALVECHRDHLRVGDVRVQVLTLKDPPAQTYAHLLDALDTIPTAFVACTEWHRLPTTEARRDLQRRRRHFFTARTSLLNYISPETKPEEMLVDDSATATVRELGQCLTALEVDGETFGEFSLTVVLIDRDPARLAHAAATCLKALSRHDATLIEERYNLLNAWLAIIPGNAAYNLRRVRLTSTAYADLSFAFTAASGERRSAQLGGEYLAALETEQQTPYFLTLHHHDVGHTLVLGATGSGKSFFLNFLVTHAQKYDPVTVIFDLGGGYRTLTALLGGSYLEVGLDRPAFTINPFSLPSSPEHRHFLAAFVMVLLQTGGHDRLTLADEREIHEAVEHVYAVDAPLRRLVTVRNLLPRRLADRLHRWVDDGPYAALFDHADDTLTLRTFQCVDFSGVAQVPAVLEPLLFYILHRLTTVVQDPARRTQLKLFVLDEAWRFVRDPTIRAYLVEALKTWRKRQAAVVLATHSADDLVKGDVLRTVVESCPTRIFLATPGFDEAAYRDLFQLNVITLQRLRELIPRQQLLLTRPDEAKVLNLHVDPESYWLYTNTPLDNARLQAAIARDGLERGLASLAHSVPQRKVD